MSKISMKLMTTVGFVMAGFMSDASAVQGKIRCTKFAKESDKCATDLAFYNKFKTTCETQQQKLFEPCQKAKCQHELGKLRKLVTEKIGNKEKLDPANISTLFEPYTAIGCPKSDLSELKGMVGLHGVVKEKAEAPHWRGAHVGGEQKKLLGKQRKARSKENLPNKELAPEHAAAEPQHEAGSPPPPPPPPPPAKLPSGALHIDKKPGAAQPAEDPTVGLEPHPHAAILKRRAALEDSGDLSLSESGN